MTETGYSIHVKKRIPFLQSILDFYCGDALISFEEDLSTFDFSQFSGASSQPTSILKRNTISPHLDFVILSLEEKTLEFIKKNVLNHIGLQKNVVHILVAKNGELVVGIYDHFDPDCVWVKLDFPRSALEGLQEQKVIASYKKADW